MASHTYTDHDPEEQPLGELFSELSGNLQQLMRKEVELAKVEATEQAKRAGKAGAMFGAAGRWCREATPTAPGRRHRPAPSRCASRGPP